MRHVRSVLCLLTILWSLPAVAGQFSIMCVRGGGFYYTTFDDETRRVVIESPSGTALRGYIDSLTTGEIKFHLLRVGQPKMEFAWDRANGNVTRIDVSPQDEFSTNCIETKLRPILSIYDRIA